jgi:hypothetical protein
MRPKIVLIILIVAIGLVALAAVLKSMANRSQNQQAKMPEPSLVEPARPTSTGPQINPNASNNAAFVEQLRVTELGRELDQVRELQAAGAGDPNTTAMLLTKVTSREPEVRRSALDALRQLNDTNAIPGLEQAATLVEDPREKVAFMDVIDYLKLPEATATDMSEGTNPPLLKPIEPRRPNPRLQSTLKTRGQPKLRQGAPPAAQPGAPTATPGAPQ